MYYELALLSVLVAGGYWGWYFVRRGALRTYGAMLIGAAALAGLGFLGRKYDEPGLGIAGAVGVGAGTCLLLLGPLARGLARRAAASERFRIAQRLLDVADVLAPGSGVGEEKALLGAMREIRDGNVEHTIDALQAAKQRAPADARLAIDERIAMLYLAAYRWDDAIAHAEANLFSAPLPDGGERNQLRSALGIAPPVWVELLGAYGYTGDLERAARMLARLEDVCAGRDDAAIWVHRGRMMFLALAGRVAAVQTLVEPRRSRHMSGAARAYWVAVALERQGELGAAEAAYAKARSRSRGRPRQLIDQALARLPSTRKAELGAEATEVVARVEASAPPTVAARAPVRGPNATRILSAALLASAAAIALLLGDSSDVGVLVRGGALVRSLVRDGEWWRLVSCVFVHVGGVHLLLNVVGLWFLGKLAEDLFGGWRTACVFALSALGGAVASFLASPASMSAGASGGVFGLLGAVFIELTLHRRRHRTAWNRGVWGSLAVVTVAQLGFDYMSPMIDQWAHGGGLALGAIAGALLSPHARWAAAGRHVARAISLAAAALCVVTAVMVARTSIADSLGRSPLVERELGGVTVTAPDDWQRTDDSHLAFADAIIDFGAGHTAMDVDHFLADGLAHARQDNQGDRVDIATVSLIALPPGWQGQELAITSTDPLGGEQHWLEMLAGRPVPGGAVVTRILVPVSIAKAAPRFLSALVASIH
ncbi:MAG TPA: rhomboid family intramembrane serine protease [Kofleriaceae bacterium]|jgi:rhomboid protease GluP